MDKKEILEILKNKVQDKIQTLETLIAETRAANNETKSSMGDKYETSREMVQQEINNLLRQLNETLKQQAVLKKLNTEPCNKVQNGALVKTNKGLFYISASLGEIKIGNNKIMSVSEEAPLAKAMFGMKIDEKFNINTISQTIEEIK